MKKLFTLFALLVCFLGAKAIEIVDFSVDYTEAGKSTIGWKADIITDDLITADAEGLHLNNPEVRENFYDYQLWIFNGASLELEQNYTIKFVAKVSDGSATVRYRIGDWGGGIAGDLVVNSTEYQEYVVTGDATVASSGLLIQFGDYVGTVSFKSITISHEGKEERPIQWKNILTNGDAEGEFGDVPCFQTKEFGMNLGEDGQPSIHNADIVEEGGNKVFVCHAKAVDPVIVFEEDTELWGTQYKAGDPKPDNAWQNQVWVVLPRAAKEGEQFKLSFKYKASRNAEVATQDHTTPGTYLGGGSYGNLKFTTEWQVFEKTFSAAADMQSIAFNLGQEIYKEDMDFYFDDVEVAEMVLDHGYFVASTNTSTGLVDYDFDNATAFVYDESEDSYVVTVGKQGDTDSWVDEVMISTVRGNTKAFKAATLKCTAKTDEWVDYEESANKKIKLPAAGVWTISIDTESKQVKFEKIEGEAEKTPIEIVANPTEVVVKGQERDWLGNDSNGNPIEEQVGEGQPWDNQLFIIANRTLSAGEETVVEFDYSSSVDAKTTTQCHVEPGDYKYWGCIGDVTFSTEEQHFTKTFTIPAEADGMKSIAFNMAEIKGACNYTIKNIVWKLADDTETLINMEGTKNFFVKEGAGTAPYEFGTDPSGISNVVKENSAAKAIYNIAGQRVSKDYKGLVIKNGNKYVVK